MVQPYFSTDLHHMVVAAKYTMLQSPGAFHHLAEIVIVVDGSAHSRVVIQKLIPRHLQKKSTIYTPQSQLLGALMNEIPECTTPDIYLSLMVVVLILFNKILDGGISRRLHA